MSAPSAPDPGSAPAPDPDPGSAPDSAPAATSDSAPPSDPTPAPDPPPHRWTRATRVSLIVLALVVAAQAAAFGATYLLYTSRYVITDNAQVDGDQVTVTAPADGVITRWDIDVGSAVRRGQVVGRVRQQGSGAQPEKLVRSPGTGTIALTTVNDGQWVDTGTRMAVAYNIDAIYVTARVPQEQIGLVRPGQLADLHVDAYPDARVTGVVTEIRAATGGPFTIYPSPDQNVQYPQRIDQYVPVRIAFTRLSGAVVAPGMNVTARIHRD